MRKYARELDICESLTILFSSFLQLNARDGHTTTHKMLGRGSRADVLLRADRGSFGR